MGSRCASRATGHNDCVVRGTVKSWNADDGWGVLVSPQVSGDVWAHFSQIEAEGFRELEAGASVDFEYEAYPEGQDGYHCRATRIVGR